MHGLHASVNSSQPRHKDPRSISSMSVTFSRLHVPAMIRRKQDKPGARVIAKATGPINNSNFSNNQGPSPAEMEQLRKHLDLIWTVSKTKGPGQKCSCCHGSGEKECDWCHGTGIMTVGDTIYVNINQSKCPVCKGTGYVKCEFCRGIGSRAQWLNPDTDPQQKHGSCKR